MLKALSSRGNNQTNRQTNTQTINKEIKQTNKNYNKQLFRECKTLTIDILFLNIADSDKKELKLKDLNARTILAQRKEQQTKIQTSTYIQYS